MPLLVVLLAGAALAGVTPAPTAHLAVATAAELTLSEDDTVSGTAGMLVGLDAAQWDEDEFGPAEDAAPAFEFTAQDLRELEDEVVADLDGVHIEVVARGDDPFGRSGFELRFDRAPFEAFTTAFQRLHPDGDGPLLLSLSREVGEPHSPEGGGPQHVLDGVIEAPSSETPAEIDLDVDVTVTFAGLVYATDGALSEQTVTWSDSGEVGALAAPQPEGRPWLLWLLLGAVVLLSGLRIAQQGNRRARERRGELPPPDAEVDGFLPVHR